MHVFFLLLSVNVPIRAIQIENNNFSFLHIIHRSYY